MMSHETLLRLAWVVLALMALGVLVLVWILASELFGWVF